MATSKKLSMMIIFSLVIIASLVSSIHGSSESLDEEGNVKSLLRNSNIDVSPKEETSDISLTDGTSDSEGEKENLSCYYPTIYVKGWIWQYYYPPCTHDKHKVCPQKYCLTKYGYHGNYYVKVSPCVYKNGYYNQQWYYDYHKKWIYYNYGGSKYCVTYKGYKKTLKLEYCSFHNKYQQWKFDGSSIKLYHYNKQCIDHYRGCKYCYQSSCKNYAHAQYCKYGEHDQKWFYHKW